MSNSERIQNLLASASELSPEQRGAFLDAACQGDTALRAEVESLLKSHDEAGQFLGAPTADVPESARSTILSSATKAPISQLREAPGTRIGPYKLLQLIGEGGFGSVFLAEQDKPVVRKVALKIIKLGMDTRQVVARFEQERQALAMMDHANIARVFDAGATETGRPFFVMELVKGDPIVDYCDKNNLSIHDRLELFAQVCQAVQHAHTKGIIHRDIKPSNILVSTQDGRPHTKVIDFGIAKATASKLTEKTLFTEHKALIGTPEYMSPEQAEGNLDIDTRTDVYSLGVLLYELLTGTTPFTSQELRSAAYGEIQRIIREVEPPKPSTRLSSNTDTLASVAAQRRIEPRKLGTLVRGELDWIVMKALEKDRQRRYETANGLMMDVRRYLAGEAIVAAPPSTLYRARKFIRRNRVMVTAGGAVALALVLGFAGTAWQAQRAAVQRDDAIAARESEKQQRLAADAERVKAEKIAEFMSDTLNGVGPSVAKGRDVTMLKEMMDAAAARIEKGELKSAPDAELSLRSTIGKTYGDLSLYDASQRMLEPAVALARATHSGDDLATAEALTNFSALRIDRGDLPGAEALAIESLEMRKRLFQGDNYRVTVGLNNVASVRRQRGDLASAESLYRESLAMSRRLYSGDHTEIAAALNNIGNILNDRGDQAGAVPLFREAVEIWKRLYPGDSPKVATGLSNLASMLDDVGDLAGAEAMSRESLEMKRRLFNGDHQSIAISLNNLAFLLQKRGNLTGAEAMHRDALAMRKSMFPGDHHEVAISLNNLANVLAALKNSAEAESLYKEALEMRRRLFPNGHADVAATLNNLATFYLSKRDYAAAEPLAREAVEMWKRLFPGDSPYVANGLNNLGSILQGRGDLAGAETLLQQSLDMRHRLYGADDARTYTSMYKLASVLVARSQYARAAPLLESAIAGAAAKLGPTHNATQSEMSLAVSLYESWDKSEPGKGYDLKAAGWKTKLDLLNADTQPAATHAASTVPSTSPGQ
ncbi:hypothetical protein BH09PLA1_BH09PLA1_09370 [soil metagenome]